ncbi:glycoside hydrolase 43 family protein [Photobacterium sp. ZSDE20]|uniref:Glycoside hydrolase 43 family protein n=1 Tax=Photobacterium pectinilyticum TaxID=2906793 RepID=A0ABT1N9F0_9GAMM|nr:glycoside hydrolase 43 family protein [Photobacterium sp. ZSDE20]MCQ1059889.1 glycoside hydrolase 43 family protein [Photobacterium sp. ZSDE20]MDD1826078.1 glycoside hydrolase 43 family protein [Photobacterium sp. ZSDE20]
MLDNKFGSWGDQGDGTYINPVLNADYPDSDIEQVGDTYYMITSKQHMSPGMPILASKDMVNWSNVGFGFNRLSWAPEYNWDRMNGYSFGVWAGDLAYNDGTWYIYQIDYNHGLMVTTAKDIAGPWSEPKILLDTTHVMDDPAVYWDKDSHKAYVIVNAGVKPENLDEESPVNTNVIYEMSWDGLSILDQGKEVYSGIGAEAAKIYKFNGYWYIFIAEWTIGDSSTGLGVKNAKNDRKQVVLRSSDSIYGPYEKKVVLQKGSNFGGRSASQGALLQAPDESWWYMHQLVQNDDDPFQGRVQCLEPVNWIDDWPIIGIDENGDGIGEPVKRYRKPINGFPVQAPLSDDDFSTDTLGPQWEWNHDPRDSHWSLTDNPGHLRLKASKLVPNGDGYGPKTNQWTNSNGASSDFWRACNTLSQRIMGTSHGVAEAKIKLQGMKPHQVAGLVRFGGVFNLMGIKVSESGVHNLFFMNTKGEEVEGDVVDSEHIYIRTTNNGNCAFFEYSLDGKVYKYFGPQFEIAFGNWTGDRLGFFTWNDVEENGYIDVESFTYDYDGPKS